MATPEAVITATHLNAAFTLGEARANAEIEDGQINPVDDLWELDDEQDIIFTATAEKIMPNTESGQLIIDNYENGYFDRWEEIVA